MSLPGVTIILQVHHHTVLYVSARGHNPSTSTSPCCTLRLCPRWKSFYKCITILYFMYLPGVTILAQVYHHIVLYVSARGENPSTSTSPYCTLRLCPGSQSLFNYITILYVFARSHNPSTTTSPYWTLRLCPRSKSFYKCITILYFMYLPGVTILAQVYHHIVLYVSARGENPSTSTSPYCTLRLCPGSKSLYNYITILYVFARGHNPSTSASPYCSVRLCPGLQSFYKYITILFYSSLPEVTILPQVHHHTVLNVSARGHNSSTSTSPYSTIPLCPGSQSFYKYITILFYTSLPGVTILPQVHHHTVLYLSVRGHSPSTSTSPYSTSLPGVTVLLKCISLYCIYVSARSHNPSTRTSPYCTLLLWPGS